MEGKLADFDWEPANFELDPLLCKIAVIWGYCLFVGMLDGMFDDVEDESMFDDEEEEITLTVAGGT